MTKKEIAALAAEELEKLYPDVECSLVYDKPYELMIATRLAAQCTDARVNVKPCGFYKPKAKSIIEMSQKLISDFGGEVPDTMEELLSLSGVGRKTANLILGDVFGKPAVVTDTHCIRITGRLGLTKNTEPAKVEKDLVKLLPPEISNHFCHQTVQFGRDICRARSPKCGECPLNYFCRDYAGNNKK